MVWTILAFLCVLATKFLTSVRLRGLKGNLEAIQPHIDELRSQLAEVEGELEAVKLKVEGEEGLLNNLKDVVRILEESLRQPDTDLETAERVQLMQSVKSDSSDSSDSSIT